jgi:hypothetical protein
MEEEKVKFQGEFSDTPIGEDRPALTAKKVMCVEVKTEPVTNAGKSFGDKIVFVCRHPDSSEPVNLSSVKYLDGDKLKQSGLWAKRDSDGKIPSKSAIANLLRFFGKNTIRELIGREFETIVDDKGYLAIKGF